MRFRSFRLVLVLAPLTAASLLSACGADDASGGGESIVGIWALESFELDGRVVDVEVGVNAAQVPWMEVDEELQGNAGCNSFGGPYLFTDGVLVPFEILMTAAACLSDDPAVDVMATEDAFRQMLWDRTSGIEVRLQENHMEWVEGDNRLHFVSIPEPPSSPPRTPPSSLGRLDCAPGTIAEEVTPAAGNDPEELVRAASTGVVNVETDPPSFWWGLDADGVVVAGLALGDVEPPVYHVYACSDSTP